MKKTEFSKTLLIQESILVWITTLFCLTLSAFCIYNNYLGSLPWISSIIVSAWAAYGVSQAMYYRKSMAENTCGGIKYETVIKEAENVRDYYSAAAAGNIPTDCSVYDSTDEYQI